MKRFIKNLLVTFSIAIFASIALFLAGPISSSNKKAAINNSLPELKSNKIFKNRTQDDKNNILFGNWKLKGENRGNIVFLLLGTGGENHEAGYLTDTIIMASYNIAENQLGLLSIPRDLFIKMPGGNFHTRINAVKYWGDKKNGKNQGIELLKNTLAEITGVKIDYYISFDFSNFENLIDKLGGIDIVLDKPVSDPKFPKGESEGYENFYLNAGEHHLNGKTALRLARSRHSKWGDFDRAARQQKVIEGIWAKIKETPGGKLDTALKYFNLWNYFRRNIQTDIGVLEIRRLLEISQNIKNPVIINKVLTSKPDGELKNARVKMKNGVAMILLPKDKSWGEIQKIAKEILNPIQNAKTNN